MKIKCNFCGNYFDDYQANCPKCGAPNEGVVRTASGDPTTIEQLKAWYESKGLPPYETTRFFIGEDYKKPRAFGIYKDPNTGMVVVYKNKDNGERAIRYQGTDEAYGVNEIFQRLKQEIIQQKMNNVKKASGNNTSSNTGSKKKSEETFLSSLLKLIGIGVGAIAALLIVIVITGTLIVMFSPDTGYYNYQDTYYFYNDSGISDLYVFKYDKQNDEWEYPVGKEADPGIFAKKKTCKKFFLSKDWNSSYECDDITESQIYTDYLAMNNTTPGYYSVNDNYYYHYGYSYDGDWYYYDDDDWVSIGQESLPVELSHAAEVGDFYYTSSWDSSTQFSDFTESSEYEDNYAGSESSDDSDYSWDSSDSWDSDSTDFSSDW